ncbi:hypothetical protein BOH66_11320 [Microbacterium aurum]|uniref:DUF2510 domain-containing protein n=2 Tax=Microbacterium aurum TaxID=36805 RepID=A0A1P8U9M0_9MICO|nr:hypothetical protein BOH66_11320 [Microbacterium aurum]
MNVDRAIATIDRAKADVTNEVARLRESGKTPAARPAATAERAAQVEAASPPPPPPPPVPAQWAADPHGRHQHRYWDGARWTEHVANDGVASVDPL